MKYNWGKFKNKRGWNKKLVASQRTVEHSTISVLFQQKYFKVKLCLHLKLLSYQKMMYESIFLMKGPTYISLESWFKIIIQNRAYSISLSVAYVYNVHKSQDKKYFYFQRWVLILIRWFNPSSQTISMKSNKSSWRHQ